MAGIRGRNLANMFDPEVIDILREQFNSADADGSGEIDAEEACTLFARFCAAGSSQSEVQRTASSLRNQMDSDRNGKISFEEYAFRFGRKLQMEVARRRREGLPLKPAFAPEPVAPLPTGLQQRKVAREEVTRTAAPPPPQNHSTPAEDKQKPGESRSIMMPLMIGAVMLVIFLVAFFLPSPDSSSSGSFKRTAQGTGSRGKSRGR